MIGKKKTTEEFIEEAKRIHGDKYDYSKTEYVNWKTKLCIICPKHGEFWQMPGNHLNKHGCPKCSSIARWEKRGKETTKGFILKASKIHNDKYDYSKVEYINCNEKVCIVCPKHGEFWQRPYCHLIGQGCKKCADDNIGLINSLGVNAFISKAKKVNNERYDYSNVEYVNNKEKVRIVCPEHGEFWQTPDNHLHGKGCPKCNESKLEKKVRETLKNNGIEFKYRERKLKWLNGLELDFYLPYYKVAIECQGAQHFKPVDFAGKGEEWSYQEFIKIHERDVKKLKLCDENNVKLLYYSNLGIEYPYYVFENENNLLNEIKKYEKKLD